MTTPPTEVKHPAKFSRPILDEIAALVFEELQRVTFTVDILDPMAGTGLIHTLENLDKRVRTTGIEIESEWAAMGPDCDQCDGQGWHVGGQSYSDPYGEQVQCPLCQGSGTKTNVGNVLHLPEQWTNTFHIVATSPTYGNRMADHHNANDTSRRMTYKHVLGRDLHPDNSGAMHFGPKYFEFHKKAWAEVTRVIKLPTQSQTFDATINPALPEDPWTLPRISGKGKLTIGEHYPGGLFILNVSNFIKGGKEVDVVGWHRDLILTMGYNLESERDVPTARLRYGANHSARVTHEKIMVFRRTLER